VREAFSRGQGGGGGTRKKKSRWTRLFLSVFRIKSRAGGSGRGARATSSGHSPPRRRSPWCARGGRGGGGGDGPGHVRACVRAARVRGSKERVHL
jgi:hypothetical protein